jgi:hypothetical protein
MISHSKLSRVARRLFATVLFLSAFCTLPGCGEQKWEYFTVLCRMEGDPKYSYSYALVVNGNQGWELVTVLPDPESKNHVILFFKRPAK